MLRHKGIDRLCCIVLAATLLLTCTFMGAAASGLIGSDAGMGYENRLFDQSYVHTVDIVMNDWEGFLETCTNEEYASCTVVIDGENCGSVAIRAKGNTSLSSVASYGNDRYSFKIEFDHYETGKTYYGLDKLSLNNLIQDKTYMKDYLAYTLMGKMGAASPLCSFVQVNVNGEPWGLYLAVEAVEDSFLTRNYGSDHGELYKPDSLSMGGGRGNGRDFDMDAFQDQFGADQAEEGSESSSAAASGRSGKGGMMNMNRGQSRSGSTGNADGGTADQTQSSGSPDAESGIPASGEAASDAGAASGGAFDPKAMAGGDFDPSAIFGEDFDLSSIAEAFSQKGGGMGFGGMGSSDVMLQYVDDDPDSYSNIFESAKTDVSEADQERLIEALRKLSEGEDLSEKLEAVDAEAVIRYLVVHNFMDNDDSYTGTMIHNYYLYEEDGALSLIPWDYNLAFGGFSMGGSSGATSSVNTPIDSPVSSGDISTRPILAWIFESEEYTELYHEIYQEFVDQFFVSGWLAEEIERVADMIAPYVEQDTNGFFTYEEFLTAAETLAEYCALRGESIVGQLDGSVPSTTEAQRTDSDALVDASHIDLSDMGEFGMGGGRGGAFEMPDMNGGSFEMPEGFSFPGGQTGAGSQDGTDAENAEGAAGMGAQEMPTGMMTPPDGFTGEMPEGFDPSAMGATPGMGGGNPFGQGGMTNVEMPTGDMAAQDSAGAANPAEPGNAPLSQPTGNMTAQEGAGAANPAEPGNVPSGQATGDVAAQEGAGAANPAEPGNVPSGRQATGDVAAQEGAGAANPAEPGNAPSGQPTGDMTAQEGAEAANPAEPGASRSRDGFSGMPGNANGSADSGSLWIMLAVCAAVLIAALLFAKFCKSGR